MTAFGDDELEQALNLETGKLGWPELQRHFARGVVIRVEAGEDLVAIAARFVADDRPAVEALLARQAIRRASDNDGIRWSTGSAVFWAVVAAPWVLVQEINEH